MRVGVGVLHSFAPHTSWPVNKMKRTTDSWRAEEGGGGIRVLMSSRTRGTFMFQVKSSE